MLPLDDPPATSARERAAQLERECGAELDELTQAERDTLAARCLPVGYCQAQYRRNGWQRDGLLPGMVRLALLEALAASRG